MNKKAQTEDWMLHTLYYLILLLVLATLTWLLFSGKLMPMLQGLFSTLRGA